ncbi:hypothetical protein CYLTODRAFT_487016 [Cylindrobasidium torrendii FP15055 ss-10]|uniref:Uncharacterized protein n=1 Tax=Cylindrobasidium torrendii FP15055 ss-10 TaxID=1314674 RepID=A0A0D7BMR3_9AGAR|nr:hypothetical protein CYLTODRAFT_487016 [Cylindrobasidium torrendii FP15055 ss-10]
MPSTVYRPGRVKKRTFPCWETLPPELWLSIFDYATHIPRSFYSAFESNVSMPYKDERRMARLHQKTRYRLPLVCVDWNGLSTPFLYQSVFITQRQTFWALLETLSRSRNRNDVRNLGSYIQVLDIPLDFLAMRADLLSYMPSLRVLACRSMYDDSTVPEDVIDTLCATCHELEEFNGEFTTGIIDKHSAAFFSAFPKLRSLSTRASEPYVGSQSLAVEPFSADSLVYLAISDNALAGPIVHPLPSLRCMSLDIGAERLSAFSVKALEVYGPQLTSLVLDMVPMISLQETEAFGRALRGCLHLHTIYVSRDVLGFLETVELPPSLRTLALQVGHPQEQQTNVDWMKVFGTILGRVKPDAIQTLMFSRRRNVVDLQTRHAALLARYSKFIEERGWALVDNYGDAVVIK